jgi:assimilatory nitrate reductase catalytic subunit
VPEEGHPGTPRLYEGGRFYHPDGRARFIPTPWRAPAEVVDDEYPVWLTTGRVISQYLSGTQTRRIGPLVDQYPEPLCEMHPRWPSSIGVADGDLVRVTSRRGAMTCPPRWSDDPPRHRLHPLPLAGRQSANQLTNRALDPISKIPEYKVSAVRVERASGQVGRRRPRRPGPDAALTEADVTDIGVTEPPPSR